VVNVQLQPNANGLNVVVLIGYQSVRKRDLTGSTGVVNMTDANKITAGSVGEAIQGLVPAVTVRNPGAPGQDAAIEIRGVGSFGHAAPLYVIYGMLADANTTVNPDDVASIQILKDASAAAIYARKQVMALYSFQQKRAAKGRQDFPPRQNMVYSKFPAAGM
jgi:hypothetical protein